MFHVIKKIEKVVRKFLKFIFSFFKNLSKNLCEIYGKSYVRKTMKFLHETISHALISFGFLIV